MRRTLQDLLMVLKNRNYVTGIKHLLKGKRLAAILTICGLLGLYASFVLTIDKFNLIQHPSAHLDCNINPIISCGSVMKTPEASLFGFANSLIGIVAFTAILVIGVTTLTGTIYKRWVWLCIQVGSLLGILLTHWLFYQSVFHIHALCPYCMVVWVITMLIFWYTLIHNLENNYVPSVSTKVRNFCRKHHADLFVCWFLIIAAIIASQFWYYWKTLI